jgi:TetR/AcrR family transcriptional regulator, regulator of biofilm formation and stress response
MVERQARGPGDPARRERIAAVVASVVAEHGVEGLTHRRVAAVAQVPLGSTTYYFKTLDDLLEAGLKRAIEENTEDLSRWAARISDRRSLIDATTELITRRTTTERDRTVVHYELYVASLRRPGLRSMSASWVSAFIEVFAEKFDHTTARAAAAVIDGLILQTIVSGIPLADDELRQILKLSLGH